MQSIPRQPDVVLPDFCNLGVMLRALALVNLMLASFALAIAKPVSLVTLMEAFLEAASRVEPVLIAALALLCPLRRSLRPLDYRGGFALVCLLAFALSLGAAALLPVGDAPFAWREALRDAALAAAGAAVVLYYFQLRERAFSPALAEARLQALQARIRPHFLFNSLTAVLSLIRSEPRRAEAALEDLADLFRVLLREGRQLLPLAEEIELCRRYLDIEVLRLGDRLAVDWQVDDAALDCAMPPLILQPLVENAVHHGIEPSHERGTIVVGVERRGAQLHVSVVNPRPAGDAPGRIESARRGTHMALDNVRERLALHFDVEARLDTVIRDDQYRVDIVLPFRRYDARSQKGGT